MNKYKYLVSIMIPTRKRTQLLKECLDSFNNKTIDKSLVEILLKIDNDDIETLKFAESYKSEIEIKIIVTDRKNGYGSLHEHYNSLAKISESEFLMVFNDDIEMITEGWEHKFKQYEGTNFIISVHNKRIKNGVELPISENYMGNPSIPADFYHEFGTLSHHPMLDDWWQNLSNAFDKKLEKWVDVNIMFKRPDGEYTDSPADETFLEGRQHINWSHHGSPELGEYINNLRKYVKTHSEKFKEPKFFS